MLSSRSRAKSRNCAKHLAQQFPDREKHTEGTKKEKKPRTCQLPSSSVAAISTVPYHCIPPRTANLFSCASLSNSFHRPDAAL